MHVLKKKKKTECRTHTRALSRVLVSFALLFIPSYIMKTLTLKVPLFSKQNKKRRLLQLFAQRGILNLVELSGSTRGIHGSGFEFYSTREPTLLHRGTLNKYLLNKGSNHFPMLNAPCGILVGRPQPDLNLCTLHSLF